MTEKQLSQNIKYYRKKKGLSQEKVAEYLDISRQAVTKWESDASRPSSDNLIKLAQLFEVDTETLLGNTEEETVSPQEEVSIGRMPWIFICISVLCIFSYIIHSAITHIFKPGAFICMFILCVPIQLFLHIYFSSAVKNNSYEGIAGFDNSTDYNLGEVKKLLIQIDLHIGILSTVYIFLLCVLNSVNLKIRWSLSGILIIVYIFNFVTSIVMSNYKMTDRIYLHEEDKKRAKRALPLSSVYTFILCVGIGITDLLFEAKGIRNNTLPAIKICGLLLFGIMNLTIGLFYENNKIKKWKPQDEKFKISKGSIFCLIICIITYVLMCII